MPIGAGSPVGVGISISTVSRSLAVHSATSDETRSEVHDVAAELGCHMPSQGRRARKSAPG
ncbi:LacI family DNA-binding transcriptional regulator [Paraburkholderia sp. MM5384-R2]|uniref:LacI family DNA-binding transcriptional regulator n=1 Tax=Paraburkholderia sp. MM5384-R2 TaxID=2723097 RepID=UPI00160A10D5